MKAYRIVAWKRAHESYETKKKDGGLNWISSPTRHDSKGLGRIMREPDGCAIYGAYQLAAQVTAKLEKHLRGWLIFADGKPLDADDLAAETGGAVETFERMLALLSDPSKRICWLELDDVPEGVSAGRPAEPLKAQSYDNDNDNDTDTITKTKRNTDTETDTSTAPRKPEPLPVPAPAASDRGGASRGAIGSASDRASRSKAAVLLLGHLEKRLSRSADARQRDGDRTTLEAMVRHYVITQGVDPMLLHDLCEQKCASPTARNPIATFIAAAKALFGPWKPEPPQSDNRRAPPVGARA